MDVATPKTETTTRTWLPHTQTHRDTHLKVIWAQKLVYSHGGHTLGSRQWWSEEKLLLSD